MKTNIVISPSQQAANKCVMGDSEADHCRIISEKVVEILQGYDCNVFLVPRIDGMEIDILQKVVNSSNYFVKTNPADMSYHLDIHTDAGYNGSGSCGFYMSEGGKAFIQKVHKEVSVITPWADGTISERNLMVLRETTAIAGLIEISFHDKTNEARWMHDNVNVIANAIARGICKACELEPKKVVVEPPQSAYELPFKILTDSGIIIHDKRFNDNITRGEVMALLAQFVK
jgi:N-acetylmuramoyl-L-alanine amidase